MVSTLDFTTYREKLTNLKSNCPFQYSRVLKMFAFSYEPLSTCMCEQRWIQRVCSDVNVCVFLCFSHATSTPKVTCVAHKHYTYTDLRLEHSPIFKMFIKYSNINSTSLKKPVKSVNSQTTSISLLTAHIFVLVEFALETH